MHGVFEGFDEGIPSFLTYLLSPLDQNAECFSFLAIQIMGMAVLYLTGSTQINISLTASPLLVRNQKIVDIARLGVAW